MPPADQVVDVNPTFTISKFLPARPIHMVGYGDMRFTDPSVTSGTNPRVRKWLAERIGQERPEVLLLTGDMPYVGSKEADWKVVSGRNGKLACQQCLAIAYDRQP